MKKKRTKIVKITGRDFYNLVDIVSEIAETIEDTLVEGKLGVFNFSNMKRLKKLQGNKANRGK